MPGVFRRRKRKKIWIIPFLLFGMVSLIALILLVYEPSNMDTSSKQQTDADLERFIKERKEVCEANSSIDYFYYKKPGGKKANNKFGIYIYAEQKEFFELAQNLVNSNGGDWGYVLIPYNVSTDRDYAKWRGVFDRLYNKHLIPIIQLWSVDVSMYKKDAKEAAEFLDRFVWPIRQRYISVYNEPNDAKFWQGKVDPKGYAQVLDYTIDTFKKVNLNFFMLNGALNVSAPTDASHMDSESFMYFMNQEVPGIFEKLDGWASHPYPQPNFTGSPKGVGRWSIRAYENELRYLRDVLDVKKELPVFITETGWAHAEGASYNASYLSVDQVAKNTREAFEEVWLKDDRVVAVTPFTIWYAPPYDHFSWVNKDGVPYKHYDVVKDMEKVSGTPEHLVQGNFISPLCD